ncbi:ATP-binding protein [Xanthomonas arboricola]|uniref:ATP-binding protein n=1 Tax=Xanthomonas arboricola TaxID=56448 RepID=UPI0015E2D0E9|nr:ATP-binding protein [Xanthomonas arboricola]
MNRSTLLGHVGAVAGASISVRQYDGISSGIAIIGGRSYRVGQVGSFVRIPQGYHDLYGIISDVGASATPETIANADSRGDRWMKIQLVGEVVETTFERGISQYPAINDQVHLVVEEDLARIYGTSESGQVTVGRLSGAESIPVRVDLDKLVTRHSAVLGSTGSGKSTTVSSLLRSISAGQGDNPSFPNARVLLIDIHGEYGKALGEVARVFRVNPLEGEFPLYIPYWALNLGDLLSFVLGKTEEKALSSIQERILKMKLEAVQSDALEGVDINSLTSESPLPFSLNELWFQLLDPEIKTWRENTQLNSAITMSGDALSLKAPVYPLPGAGNSPPFINKTNVLSIRRQLDQLRSRLLDRQFDFMLHPGDWEPGLDGKSKRDLSDLLESWLGHDKPITVLDLSGVPSLVLMRLIGGILNIIYEALFWSRERVEGGRQRPLLVVMEEAHRYLGQGDVSLAREAVQRIVKEGRKFGIGAMIVSQRPSEIDDTILSQCGTFFSLRLSNSSDRSKVQAALPDSLSGIVDSLPVLRTGEAVIIGEAAKLPVRCRITLPEQEKRPASEDPKVAESWRRKRGKEDYSAVAAAWRSQDPHWKKE